MACQIFKANREAKGHFQKCFSASLGMVRSLQMLSRFQNDIQHFRDELVSIKLGQCTSCAFMLKTPSIQVHILLRFPAEEGIICLFLYNQLNSSTSIFLK